MAVDKAYIVGSIGSEFASVTEQQVTNLVALAALQVSQRVWGDLYDPAVAYLVCHMLKLDQLKGKGAVTFERLGDLSRSFSGPRTDRSGDDLDHTSYGRRFKEMRSMVASGPIVRGC